MPTTPIQALMAAANRRGHLCPSDDRDNTAEENRTTFILSNIVPQAPTFNQQSWRLLEEYCRSLVRQDNELYIIAGTWVKGVKAIKERLVHWRMAN
ncbi:DNA/RNA non-specific endonuclease [Spirosoma sp. KNUC1025]|uniref:DNA/RNA non-specific endonuclease n=1 Tax=Spirosoma sp. KNUC1025 TaxID=2894082 RepID=UPI001E47C95B|nr:DNA/RNA non-specific endonuclease [Spirosoma sp. KNUC1025]UFH57723.1 DNA/RNA non-specific endonuclease [Spirosoma sp. KNUC1025]